jgi:glycosyltransferase involved in cell wall biosynthesis
MKVSILLISYNQAQYIRQAVNSIIDQRISYPYEIIVADDCSNDGTYESICEAFNEAGMEYRSLPREVNLGFKENYRRAFAECLGEYIAVLEGDDYWCDNLRIMKHVEFQDNMPECVISFNRFQVLKERTGSMHLSDWNIEQEFELITTPMMALKNRIGNLSACFFRRSAILKLANGFFDMGAADWLYGMALAEIGLLVRLKEPMSVYRVHQNGLWSGRSHKENMIRLVEYTIPRFDQYFEYRYHQEFEEHKNRIIADLAKTETLKYRLLSLIPSKIKVFIKTIILKTKI